MFSDVLRKCGSVGLFVWSVGYSATNIVCAQGERENAIKSLQEEIKILLKKDISEEEIGKAIVGIKDKEVLKKIYENKEYCRHIASMLVADIEKQRQKVFSCRKVLIERDYFKTDSGLNYLSDKRLELREILVKEIMDYKSVEEAQEKVDNWIWVIPERYCAGLCDQTTDLEISDIARDLIDINKFSENEFFKSVDESKRKNVGS